MEIREAEEDKKETTWQKEDVNNIGEQEANRQWSGDHFLNLWCPIPADQTNNPQNNWWSGQLNYCGLFGKQNGDRWVTSGI